MPRFQWLDKLLIKSLVIKFGAEASNWKLKATRKMSIHLLHSWPTQRGEFTFHTDSIKSTFFQCNTMGWGCPTGWSIVVNIAIYNENHKILESITQKFTSLHVQVLSSWWRQSMICLLCQNENFLFVANYLKLFIVALPPL